MGTVVSFSLHAPELHPEKLWTAVAEARAVLHEIIGPRDRVGLDPATLRRLCPDVRHRDLYICGPEGFTEGVVGAARWLSVPEDRIHVEEFAF